MIAGQAGASANWPLSGPSEKQLGLMALFSGIPLSSAASQHTKTMGETGEETSRSRG